MISGITVTEDEVYSFYTSHEEMFGTAPFEDVKDMIMSKLLEQKQREAWAHHVRGIGLQLPISVNAAWIGEQALKIKDNPIDRERVLGKPLLVLFSSDKSPVCQKQQPIIEDLINSNSENILILIVNTDDNGLLTTRYDISTVPALLFFDKTGKETERYLGYISQEKLLEKIKGILDTNYI